MARFTGFACILFLLSGAWFSPKSYALEPAEVLVLANRNAARSVGLAKYYMERRGIPEDHLLLLWMTDREGCTREEYEKKVAGPVRNYIREKDPERRIRCLLVLYGIPLKIGPPELSDQEKRELERLREREKVLEKSEKEGLKDKGDLSEIHTELKEIRKRISLLDNSDEGASLDSELALVLKMDYPLSRWIHNPFFVGHQGGFIQHMPDKGEVLMVARLDGPSDEIVRRIIDDGLRAEKTGLRGKAYFDARRPLPKGDNKEEGNQGYRFYDRSIHGAAERVQKSGKMPVILNDKPELFQPRECPDAALYCGWYSLARYVDAFEWRSGSVGYHIASAECDTLKRPGSQVWCKRMIEEGVAATAGPVNEPYVQAFPVPELFFGLLLDGYWSLAECYALSQPFWSWQMVLIGDPLYRPFKNISDN